MLPPYCISSTVLHIVYTGCKCEWPLILTHCFYVLGVISSAHGPQMKLDVINEGNVQKSTPGIQRDQKVSIQTSTKLKEFRNGENLRFILNMH